MEALLSRTLTAGAERKRLNSERLSREKVIYLGHLAIELEQLGINDPVTHLFQYLEKGEGAVTGIEQDFVTDVAERLPKNHFVNYVDFKFANNDFVSAKDEVSMDLMTKNNLDTLNSLLSTNPDLKAEYDRAVVDAEEVPKLVNWFPEAVIGDYLVFESLPIGDQQFAVSRIYQKQSDASLCGSFVSLHSSTIEGFNKLRGEMGVEGLDCETELDILKNNYEFHNPKLTKPDDFIEFYVGVHDQLLKEKYGKDYHFGIEQNDDRQKQDGLAKVRSLPKLTAAYLDMVKALAHSDGLITSEILHITNELGVNCGVVEGNIITMKEARDLLSSVILGITSAIDKADDKVLDKLRHANSSQSDNYAAISYFGGQASAAGESYSSGGCPEIVGSNNTINANGNNSESDTLGRAFDIWGLKNFGEEKIGTCRIKNCPSRLNNKRVKVGGCDICVTCHMYFLKNHGKSPERFYDQQRRRAEAKRQEQLDTKKHNDELQANREKSKIERRANKARIKNKLVKRALANKQAKEHRNTLKLDELLSKK